MTNGALIKELKELEKEYDLPDRVTNRLIITAVIQLYEKVYLNENVGKKVSRLEGIVALLSSMWLAIVGWIIFAG